MVSSFPPTPVTSISSFPSLANAADGTANDSRRKPLSIASPQRPQGLPLTEVVGHGEEAFFGKPIRKTQARPLSGIGPSLIEKDSFLPVAGNSVL